MALCVGLVACSASTLPDPVTLTPTSPEVRLATSTRGTLSWSLAREGVVRLSSHRGDGPQQAAVAFGVVQGADPKRYYDPEEADGVTGLVWHAAETVRAARSERGAVVLEVVLTPGPGVATVRFSPSDLVGVSIEVSATGVTGDIVFTRLGVTAPPGPLYGGGESFSGFDGRGRVWPMQFRVDGSTDSGFNERHVPVPFVTDKRGAAVFVEEKRPGAFDLARTTPNRMALTFAASRLRAHLFAAPSASDAVAALSRKTAMPRLPPAWSFGPQQWRNEHRDTAEVLADARAMRELGIPGSVVWIDNPWQTAYSTFTFNPVKYAGAREAIAELNRIGYRVIVWTCPYLNDSDDSAKRPGMTTDNLALFEDAKARQLLVRFADSGAPFTVPWNWGRGASVDFSTAPGLELFAGLMRRVVDVGVEGFKLDYGEEVIPELLGYRLGLRFNNGEDESTMHAEHAIGFHRAARQALGAAGKDGFLLGRASGYGGQAHVDAIWPGDLDADDTLGGEGRVGGLRGALSGAVSLAMSGFPSFGSDIGGYRGRDPSEALLLRWAAMQAPLPIMQLGGGGPHHNPWLPPYTAAAVEGYRRLARLHLDLFPYLYGLATRASQYGTAYVLPPAAAYPDDPAQELEADAYVVGPALYVAPIVSETAMSRTVRLPAGARFMNVGASLTGRAVHAGGAPFEVAMPPGELPLFLRIGASLPLGEPALHTLAPSADPAVVSAEARPRRLRVLWAPGPSTAATYVAPSPASVVGMTAPLELHAAGPQLRLVGLRQNLARLVVDAAHETNTATPRTVRVSTGDGSGVRVLTAQDASDPWTCDACARLDPSTNTLSIGLAEVGDGTRLELLP